MTWWKTTLLITVAITAVWAPHRASAAPLRIPAMAYPQGAQITYRPTFANAEMDCTWGFFCEGNIPLFHGSTQDQLHRVSGWAQFAVSHRHRASIVFQLFASRYSPSAGGGRPWSALALADLKASLHRQGYSMTWRSSHPGLLIAFQPSDTEDLLIMASRSGRFEVEAVAMYDHGSPWAVKVAKADLALHVDSAMHGNA